MSERRDEEATRTRRRWFLAILVPVATLVVLVGGWQLYVSLSGVAFYILPSPGRVFETLIADWGILGPALVATLTLTFEALALAVVGGVLLAVLMAQSRWAELALYPYAVILQVTPVVAIAPLLLVWVPSTQAALLILAWIVAFFPILTNTAQGLKSVDHGLLALFDLYGAGRWRTLIHLRIPNALPYFMTGLKIGGGLALIGAVVAELAAGSSGRGSGLAFRLIEANFRSNAPRAFAALVLLSLTGIAIFFATSLISWLVLRRWHESAALRER
ncbi:MAG: ABC transporter permease [Bauldia sp.]|nr:ABC transporter permease [Bauldia sp.]